MYGDFTAHHSEALFPREYEGAFLAAVMGYPG
jgi:hypothetical protein